MTVLYTNHCPKCTVVKAKLDAKGVAYTLIDDDKILSDKGFDFMPVLEVDGTQITSMIEINKYIEQL